MLKPNGAEELRQYAIRSHQRAITQVVPGVWHVLGMGHSNAVVIEGGASVILVDTLDTLERGEALAAFIQETVGKPVKTILYTHGHPDHRGGAGAFAGTQPEIIAFAAVNAPLEQSDSLQDILQLRGSRQFGYTLSDGENLSQGLGIREGITHGESRAFCPPTTVYQEGIVTREIDGVTLELIRLPGETDDQMAVWLPDQKVLCCGDNYYGCFPNLYAIRGGQYRDIAAWIRSLDALLAFPAEYLLPGHTPALLGRDTVQTVLRGFRDAIAWVLEQTLRGMNEGRTMDQLAAEIALPDEYAGLPYLGEHYGCVEWTVRAIYTAYLGWFDGNPTHLHPLPPNERAVRAIRQMGGAQEVMNAAERAGQTGEDQWCLELCDLLLDAGEDVPAARRVKAATLRRLAEQETSANGRHYYLVCAHELERQDGAE